MRSPRSDVVSCRLLFALLVTLSACASGGGGQSERGILVEVQIINDLIPPRSVTVTAAPAQGGRRSVLGSVAPSQTRSFKYRLAVTGQEYAFTAEDPDRESVTSRAVPLGLDDFVVWSLRSNQLELRN